MNLGPICNNCKVDNRTRIIERGYLDIKIASGFGSLKERVCDQPLTEQILAWKSPDSSLCTKSLLLFIYHGQAWILCYVGRGSGKGWTV